MLPLKIRLKKDSFMSVMKDGVFIHSDNVYLRLLDRNDNLPSLFAFVVPNKVKKTSVGRHLIKRRLTSAFEKLLSDLKPGFSGIIFAKKDISTLPYSEIEKEVVKLLTKAKTLNRRDF